MQEVPEYGREWNIPLDIQLDNGSAQFDCDPREDVDLSRVGLTPSRTHSDILEAADVSFNTSYNHIQLKETFSFSTPSSIY